MVNDKDGNVIMAELAEYVGQYDVMLSYALKLAPGYSPEERNLFSDSAEKVVDDLRRRQHLLGVLEGEVSGSGEAGSLRLSLIKKYKVDLYERHKQIVLSEVIPCAELQLEAAANDNYEGQVFFEKIIAKQYQWLSECSCGVDQEENSEQAEVHYKNAVEIASQYLPSTEPARLRSVLAYSAFLYEIKHDSRNAIRVARNAFDTAIENLESLDEESYKDSTLILQLLRDNLTLWNDLSESKNNGQA